MITGRSAAGARTIPPLGLVVFVVGTAALGLEIAAVRLMAPYFGASMIVWANTIGIVLVALSAGYWWGGRIADRWPKIEQLCAVVMTAAVFTALLPFVARPALGVAVDALESISAGAFLGSFVATLALVAIPVALLGTVAPWALRIGLAHVSPDQAGMLAGRLYAISTIGSLFGTLVSALFLVPFIGTKRTFLVFALLLATTAAIGLRARRATLLIPLALLILLVMPVGAIKGEASDGVVIFETESDEQYARVVERADGSRALELNEGLAVHSLYRPETVLTGNIWDVPLVLPFATRDRAPRRIAVLGNAAGTIARAYGHFFPDTYVDGVEIDAKLTEIGRRFFSLDNPRFTAFHEDARPFIERTDRRYDAIQVDAYRQPYIPFYLTTREFFEQTRDRLTASGSVMVNVGHPEGNDDLEKALSATLGSVFAHVSRSPAEPTNTMLIASDRPISAARIERAAGSFPGDLRAVARAIAATLGPPLAGGAVFTDDRAPVEWLIDRSIVKYAAGG
ncbi:MAG: fused MFS/spermidine synthase [Solirubrobacterales bacterium]